MDYFLKEFSDKKMREGRVLDFFDNHDLNSLIKNKPNDIDLEIGCGHGHWINAYAMLNQTRICIGIDLNTKRIVKSNHKKKLNKLHNLFFLKADANEFINYKPTNVKFSKIFIFFPDPWPKNKHHKKRLIQHSFLKLLLFHTGTDSQIFFRTDHVDYFNWTKSIFEASEDWKLSNLQWPLEHQSYFQDLLPSFSSLSAIKL
jgi:tRNA (guanine-N7-)-methyltransferase